MDHRPFEDWLLNHQTLTVEEKRQLTAHLQACSTCTALSEVNLALKSVRMAAPAAGFTDRFQARLILQKKALRRRNLWGFMLLGLSTLSALVLASWPVLRSIAQAPVDWLSSGLASLISFWAAFEAVLHGGLVLFKVIPGFVPVYVWTIILFAAGGWSLLWVFSLMKFTKIPQGV